MPPSQFFVACVLSFLGGVLLAGFELGHFELAAFIVGGIGFAGFLAALVLGKKESRFAVLCAGVVFFCLGIIRYSQANQPSQFSSNLNRKLQLEGVVVADADIRIKTRQLTVRPDGYSQNILVVTLPDQDVTYGDRVWLTGILTEPAPFSDFNYKEYLKRYQIYAMMRRPKIIVLRRHQGNPVIAALYNLKNYYVNKASELLGEPESSLVVGILIGARKTLSEDIVNEFNRTGLSHIVAVSGYNISIIISSLGFLAKYLGRRASFYVSLGIIVGFVVLTGASASILRAGIMGGLVLFASHIGRPYSVTPSLVFSAVVMAGINPRIMYWDMGFQLSFAATAGIIYALPHLEIIFSHVPERFELKSILLTTLSASLSTWPLLVGSFGRVSVIAPVANLLILPTIPWVMLLGFLILLPVAGTGFAWMTHLLLVYILKVLAYLSSLSWASKEIDPSPANFAIALSLSLAIYLTIRILSRKLQKRP